MKGTIGVVFVASVCIALVCSLVPLANLASASDCIPSVCGFGCAYPECFGYYWDCPGLGGPCCGNEPVYDQEGALVSCLYYCPAECPCPSCTSGSGSGSCTTVCPVKSFIATDCQSQDPTFVRSDPRDLRGLREARQKAAAKLVATAR